MDTKQKLFAILSDVDQMNKIIDNACNSQLEMVKCADRKKLLGERMNDQKLECPECHTRQVQLVDYIDVIPAQWKCRHCKHKFEWEGA